MSSYKNTCTINKPYVVLTHLLVTHVYDVGKLSVQIKSKQKEVASSGLSDLILLFEII